MHGDDPLSSGQSEHGGDSFTDTAYVACDRANCLYEPDPCSAVRLSPPYGTEVEVVRDEGSWVLIRFCGKDAWCPRANLSATLVPKRAARTVGVVPEPNPTFRSSARVKTALTPVEYGSRGGRFMRTRSGFRRYF